MNSLTHNWESSEIEVTNVKHVEGCFPLLGLWLVGLWHTLSVNAVIGAQSLLETHDSVASKSYETLPSSPCAFLDAALNNQPMPPDAVRMVGIRKVSGEHLVRLPSRCDCSMAILGYVVLG